MSNQITQQYWITTTNTSECHVVVFKDKTLILIWKGGFSQAVYCWLCPWIWWLASRVGSHQNKNFKIYLRLDGRRPLPGFGHFEVHVLFVPVHSYWYCDALSSISSLSWEISSFIFLLLMQFFEGSHVFSCIGFTTCIIELILFKPDPGFGLLLVFFLLTCKYAWSNILWGCIIHCYLQCSWTFVCVITLALLGRVIIYHVCKYIVHTYKYIYIHLYVYTSICMCNCA